MIFFWFIFLSFNLFSVKISTAQSTIDVNSLNRISDYSKNFPAELLPEDLAILIDRCPTIQKKVVEARDRVNLSISQREEAYGSIENKLSSIQSRLSGQGLDTSVIDLMLASYRIEVSNFKLNAERYSTILTDASTLDCKNNPSGFKSSILAARASRILTVETMVKIRQLYKSSFVSGFELLDKQLSGIGE